MKNKLARAVAFMLVLVGGVGASYYLLTAREAPQPEAMRPPAAPLVEVLLVSSRRQSLVIETQGTVQARRQIDLVAEVGGKVERVAAHFTEGSFVGTGELLVQLERDDFQFALLRARAEVADARQLLAVEEGRARQARREWRDLKDSDANALFLRKPQLASARAARAAAEANRDQAMLNLQRTTLSAPFAGRIMETYVDLGQYVSVGMPIARISGTDAVEVRLPLTDRQLALLDPSMLSGAVTAAGAGQAIVLSARFGGREWQWQGTLRRTDGSIDSRSRVLHAVAEIREPFAPGDADSRPPLIIGQFVEATIPGREIDDVLMIPREALRPRNTVWAVDDDNRLQIVPVEVLHYGAEFIALAGASGQQMRVITSQLPLALPGLVVKPQLSTAAGA